MTDMNTTEFETTEQATPLTQEAAKAEEAPSAAEMQAEEAPCSAAEADAEEEVSSEGGAADPDPDPTPVRKSPIKRVLAACGIFLAALLLAFGVLCAVLFRLTPPITVDLNATITVRALDGSAFLSAITECEPSPDSIDTSSVREDVLHLTFFGFIRHDVPVSVRDLSAPTVTVYRITTYPSAIIPPALCVHTCEDETAVTHTFSTPPDTSKTGTTTAVLRTEDSGGNVTETPVEITVSDSGLCLLWEFGSEDLSPEEFVRAQLPDYDTYDCSAVKPDLCGVYVAAADKDDTRILLSVAVADTAPPTGKASSHNLLAGMTLRIEDFITELSDASEVTLSYVTAPDFSLRTPQTVSIEALDTAGNATIFTSHLLIWELPGSFRVECGTTAAELRRTLFAPLMQAHVSLPAIDTSFDPQTAAPGTYSVPLHGAYSSPVIEIVMVDTTAPKLTLKPGIAYIGAKPTPESLVDELIDATDVTLSFLQEPNVSVGGVVTVTVCARDAGGNVTQAETTLTVVPDTTAPVISGVKDIFTQINGTVSYRNGVTAYDNADGTIRVTVDASGVDITTAGVYTVLYKATDRAGNTATKSAKVYVTGATQESIDAYADYILSITTTSAMTDRQKAYAIYSWCAKNIRYSTATSHLMGHYLQAAYSGFTTRAGNCYTYYAVASALLTRAGIENMEIHRNNPTYPHYWNLVKIDGSWYHLDTCPKQKKYPLVAFLLTDQQVREYSKKATGYYSFDASQYPPTP